jgi:predicted acylesterase/phospholipase RssA
MLARAVRWPSGARPATVRIASAAAGLTLALAGGCAFRTDALVHEFNQGALSGAVDPKVTVCETRSRLVARLVRDDLVDGYFGQGGGADGALLKTWLEDAEPRFPALVQAARRFPGGVAKEPVLTAELDCPDEPRAPERSAAADESSKTAQQAQQQVQEAAATQLDELLDKLRKEAPFQLALCPASAGERNKELAAYADAIRFSSSLVRAASAVALLSDEGMIDHRSLAKGTELGFREARGYLASRRWRREVDRRTTALVVKGGASTGIFSAGVVWIALQLVDGCMRSQSCLEARGDVRFKLLSGTSTGAMVVTAVDRFNADHESTIQNRRAATGPASALGKLPQWFTCLGARDLYCVDLRFMWDLGSTLKGVVKFDGIEALLEENVSDGLLNDQSELLLNTVEFRSGESLTISDQNPFDACDRGAQCTPAARKQAVVRGGLASIPLPIIAKPVDEMVVQGAPRVGTFLDGGVRAEIPLLPLAQRGAERVLVVSSSQSVLASAPNPESGADIGFRFINIAADGNAETGFAHAMRHAESVRSQEIELCERTLCDVKRPHMATLFGNDLPAERCRAFCEARWDMMCTATPAPVDAPQPSTKRDLRALRTSALWHVEALFRDELRVDAEAGYNFDPSQLRRLFLAGTEAARQHCRALARLLGVLPTRSDGEPLPVPATAPTLARDVVRWCAAPLPATCTLCSEIAQVADSDETLHICGDERELKTKDDKKCP